MTRDQIRQEISKTLVEMFQLDEAVVTADARLMEDLDLDSIDAVDLAAKVQEMTGKRLKESDLRGMKTIEDVVGVIESLLDGSVGGATEEA